MQKLRTPVSELLAPDPGASVWTLEAVAHDRARRHVYVLHVEAESFSLVLMN